LTNDFEIRKHDGLTTTREAYRAVGFFRYTNGKPFTKRWEGEDPMILGSTKFHEENCILKMTC